MFLGGIRILVIFRPTPPFKSQELSRLFLESSFCFSESTLRVGSVFFAGQGQDNRTSEIFSLNFLTSKTMKSTIFRNFNEVTEQKDILKILSDIKTGVYQNAITYLRKSLATE